MCDSLDQEIACVASNIHNEHGRDANSIATLVHVSACLFGHYESLHSLSLSPLLALQRDCITLWLQERGVQWSEADSARQSLHRADHVAGYLASLQV